RCRKNVVPPHIPLDFPGTASIAVHVDGPLLGPPPRLAPSAGLVVVQASRWAMRIQRTKTMASKQPRKQTKSGAKVDTGEANNPAPDRQSAPRRRVSKARSGSAVTGTSLAAVPAGGGPEGAPATLDPATK